MLPSIMMFLNSIIGGSVDETKLVSDVMALVNEMWIYIAAIWCTTQLTKDMIKWVPNQLLSILIAIVYGVGAHFSGYMSGGLFVVLCVKTPIAAITSQLVHNRLYNVFRKDTPVAISNIMESVKGTGSGDKVSTDTSISAGSGVDK